MSGVKTTTDQRLIKKDGTVIWTQVILSPVYDDMGQVIRVNGITVDINEKKSMESALIEAESKYRNLVEGALIGVYIFQDDRLTYVNPCFERMFGFKQSELSNINVMKYVHPEDGPIFRNSIKRTGNEDKKIAEQIRAFKRDGTQMHVMINALATIYKGKDAIIGTVLDITDEKRAVDELKKNENLLSDVFDSIKDGIVVIDKDFNVVRTNKTMDEWYKDVYPLVGKKCYQVSTNRRDAACEGCPSIAAMEMATPQTIVFDYVNSEGEKCWRELYTYPLIDDDGSVTGVIEQIKDITEKKKIEDKINKMAFHDALTGLPNRYMMTNHLKAVLNDENIKVQKLGVMFIDLDRFKMINDTMGHSLGDKLLKQVSVRIKDCVRKGDIVSRHGGDEFVILLKDIERDELEQVASRIVEVMSDPFVVEGHEMFMSPSIGISTYPEDGSDAETLVKYADAAMYLAKEKGKNNYQFFNQELNRQITRKLNLENGLRRALDNGEFVLHYQPQVNLSTGKITGMEALIRWSHPELGIVNPAEFIPVAEETGLIVSIGRWVVQTVCRQNKQWQDQGYEPITIAVNISAKQFQQKDFVAMITDTLEETGLKPEYLEIEITEGIMLNIEELSSILDELKKLGVKISIDDFGTGYSSLGALKHLPIDVLKIDKSFINGMALNSKMSALVKTIIAMGDSLDFRVVAEGIETEEQADFLTSNKCSMGQGYFYSHPLPAIDICRFLKKLA